MSKPRHNQAKANVEIPIPTAVAVKKGWQDGWIWPVAIAIALVLGGAVAFNAFAEEAPAPAAPTELTVTVSSAPPPAVEAVVEEAPDADEPNRLERAWDYVFNKDASGILKAENQDLEARVAQVKLLEEAVAKEQADVEAAHRDVAETIAELDSQAFYLEKRIKALTQCVAQAMDETEAPAEEVADEPAVQ